MKNNFQMFILYSLEQACILENLKCPSRGERGCPCHYQQMTHGGGAKKSVMYYLNVPLCAQIVTLPISTSKLISESSGEFGLISPKITLQAFSKPDGENSSLQGVDFNNILQATFLFKIVSYLFLHLQFMSFIIWQKKIGKNLLLKCWLN